MSNGLNFDLLLEVTGIRIKDSD